MAKLAEGKNIGFSFFSICTDYVEGVKSHQLVIWKEST